jgi:hypothetical protein
VLPVSDSDTDDAAGEVGRALAEDDADGVADDDEAGVDDVDDDGELLHAAMVIAATPASTGRASRLARL